MNILVRLRRLLVAGPEWLLDASITARERLRVRFSTDKRPSFTSIKWLSSRQIRQQYFADQFQADSTTFDHEYIISIDQKRAEAEKQFLAIAFVQITITGVLLLTLVGSNVSISLFGVSSADIHKLRDILLFCQALIVSWSIVVQQYHHKLEDLIVAWVKLHSKSEEAWFPAFMRYLGPLETFNFNVPPYKQHQLHNVATRNIYRIHSAFRGLTAFGFMLFTTITPIFVAISTLRAPSNGWLSYAAVIYWATVFLFATASATINIFGVPYTDSSYVMKLDALMKSDPSAHGRVMAEIKRTGKLVDLG